MPSFTTHLDRRYQLTATYSASRSRWALPFNDTTVNCLVVGDSFGDAGTVYLSGTIDGVAYNDFSVSAGVLVMTTVTTDYSGAECTMGSLYSMSIVPTRPFYRDRNGNADFVTRIGVRHLDVAYYKSSGFRVKRAMTGRADSTRTFAGDGTVSLVGKLRAHLNGNNKDATWTVESLPTVPKRVIIPSLQFDADANARRDG